VKKTGIGSYEGVSEWYVVAAQGVEKVKIECCDKNEGDRSRKRKKLCCCSKNK